MQSISIKEIVDFTKGKVKSLKDGNFRIREIVTDSRQANNSSLYIPIIGEKLDGHQFLNDAYNNGCRNFLTDKDHEFIKDDINLIEVKDTTKSYGDIAKNYKNKFKVKTIGVTGSVGKTSTKDIIYSVLKEKYKTLKNEGNFNNEIGIPKTILNLDSTYSYLVSEMGLSFKKDIAYFTSIVKPDIAVISSIGMSHIENFNNQDEIFDAKMEITTYFSKNNILIVNGDDKYLKTLRDKKHVYKLLTYGFNSYNDLVCKSYEILKDKIKFVCQIKNKEEEFVIPSIATHNILNALSAILVGLEQGISIEKIKKGLSDFSITKGRLTIINKKDITIIDDSYNASSDSIISALKVLNNYKTRKVAILGDVLETGRYAKEIHEKIGDEIYPNATFLIACGNDAKYYISSAIKKGLDKKNTVFFKNYEDLLKEIDKYIKKGDTILVKASHGILLDRVVEYLDNNYE